jgi:hypothetical protein
MNIRKDSSLLVQEFQDITEDMDYTEEMKIE